MQVVLEIDKLKAKNKEYKVGKRKQQKLDTLSLRWLSLNSNLLPKCVKTLHSQRCWTYCNGRPDNGFANVTLRNKDNEDINYKS